MGNDVINSIKPSSTQGHDAVRGDVLERISKEYGKPEEKQREASKKLGKDEFFKIMVNQIQHQDPMKPYENEQMAAQMAQFSALEQMVNMNQAIEKLAQAQQPLHNLGAAGLIGKYVTADSSRVIHTEGKYTEIAFDLPMGAQKVRATIMNEKGESVREIEFLKPQKGANKIPWDGKRTNNMNAPSGNYTVQISAYNEKDKPTQVVTQKADIVHGVGFDGKETILYVGDPKHPQKLLLKNVSRIVDAQFPNYKEIIPKKFTSEATILKSDFSEMLRKARVFSGNDMHVGLHLYPKKKIFTATARSADVGEMSDDIDAAISGEDLDINFHIGYLSDCLATIQSDSIVLSFAGLGRPLVIRGVSDGSFTYLVMPLNR